MSGDLPEGPRHGADPTARPKRQPIQARSEGVFAGTGEMATLMRAHDWLSSPIGAPASWPQSLRLMVRLMLNSNHPMFVFWGPQLVCFYNDAYRQTMGPERHPGSLGRPGREVWDEIWDIIGPEIDFVMRGDGATWHARGCNHHDAEHEDERQVGAEGNIAAGKQ